MTYLRVPFRSLAPRYASPGPRRSRSAAIGSFAVALAATLVAGCGSTSPAAKGNSAPPSSSATSGSSSGIPALANVSIPLGKGAGAPHVGDTVSYAAVQILNKMGASATLTLGQGPAVVAGVVGGHLVATAGPLDAELNGGLVVFGPAIPGQDYQFITSPKTSSVSALRGKVLAVSSANVGDDILTSQLLAKYGLTRQSVTIEYSGAEDNSLSGFISGRVEGFWASSDSVVALKQKNIPFRTIIAARTLAPSSADSYEAASAGWLHSHPAEAMAIDLAWLYSAQTFNNNEAAWASYAKAYTGGSVPAAAIALDYSAYHEESLFPTSAAAFTPANVQSNVQQDIKAKGITRVTTTAPESSYADFRAWNAAVAVFNAHPNALG